MSALLLPSSRIPQLLAALLSILVVGAEPALAKRSRTYTDTKDRFALELPPGWKLHPMPGDTTGMTFRRDLEGTFALFRVSVREAAPGETVERALDAATAPFSAEIGFRAGPDVPTSVGLLPARRRSFTVYASGDERTVRAIELFVVVAFGHVHVLHFECLEKERGRFARDTDRLVGSYRPLIGRSVYGPLVGTWTSTSGGPDLVLQEDGGFSLGPLRGTFHADGGRLSLHVEGGSEHYRYRLKGRHLTLTSPNLEGSSEYVRSGAAAFPSRREERPRARPLTAEELVGRWRVVGVASTDPLVLQLSPTGSVSFGPLSGRWRFRRGLLTIESTAGTTVTYHASKEGDRLILGGGDLEKELQLERE